MLSFIISGDISKGTDEFGLASLPRRLARFVVGLLGVLVFWYGLGLIFPRGESFVPYALRFVRYSLLGFWVSAGAPFFFTKLKLS